MSGSAEYLCYTDGSCKAAKGAPGGFGFWIKPPQGRDPVEGFGSVVGTLAKVMEYRAVAEALHVLPADVDAVVFSDNQSLVENLGKHLERGARGRFRRSIPRSSRAPGELPQRLPTRTYACVSNGCALTTVMPATSAPMPWRRRALARRKPNSKARLLAVVKQLREDE